MRVVLVRHGEVEERYKGCYNGHNNVSLSQKGIEQSRVLGARVAHETFDAVFCSDLQRAKETLAAMSHNFLQRVEPIYTPALREKSWGRHEGMDFAAICASEGLEYRSFLEWIEALDGESLESFERRVKDFFFSTLPRHDKKTVLIVTHAGVMQVLRVLVEKISYEEAFSCNIPHSSYVLYCYCEQNGYKIG